MIKIPSIPQIQELDASTIADQGINSLDLMERAARAVSQHIMRRWGATTPIVVFAGPGNNGGDGLAVARMLSDQGYSVEVYLFNTKGSLSPECQANLERLKTCQPVKLTEVTAQFEPPQLTATTLIVDALFGSGLNKPLTGGYALLVKLINASPSEVVAIDLPSGMMWSPDAASSCVVRANLTLTFQLPKLAMMLADKAEDLGEVEVLNIGLSAERIEAMSVDHYVIEESDIAPLLLPRAPFGHKGTFGTALLIAGQYGMAGAAVLAAKACFRSGVGKVILHTPQMNNSIIQIAVPEAIVHLDMADTVYTTPVTNINHDALCIGPGLGTDLATAAAFIKQVNHTDKPVLIDADGLNILSQHHEWLNILPAGTILTPHPGELSRLVSRNGDSATLLSEACDLATRHKFYVVLKGHRTAICTPEGKVYFNATGNSGMATAGSGDVLSGIITALLAQHYTPLSACMLGVWLHGTAGDLAAEALTEESIMASDIIAYLPAAFSKIRKH